MAEEKKQSVTVYSYRKVWFVEKKIYAFQNIVLPFPIAPYEVLEFLAVVGAMLVMGRIFPILNNIPVVLRYGMLPYVTVKYLMKVKLDGKNPVKFLRLSAVPVYQKGMHRAVPNLQRPWSDSKNQLELRQKAGIMEEKDVSVSHFVFYKKYNF